jgi:hypothetical protein
MIDDVAGGQVAQGQLQQDHWRFPLQLRLGQELRPARFGVNDLQAAAEASCAEVAQALRLMARTFGNSRMTGSGSAVFSRVGAGVRPEATWPCGDLPPGWVGRLCRSLPVHPLEAWVG